MRGLLHQNGKPSRLVRFNTASETRPVKPSFWSHKPVEPEYAAGKQVMFSDIFPYLIASQASLDTLNEHLKEPVPINRFRPNIHGDGCEPFSEDLLHFSLQASPASEDYTKQG